ncbi:MAG: hypothetical protein HYY43_01540 [Deltaproteobacteria bacterium]|nr:hypothetical protein [Deltaproteobacteria bacterium]MBI2974260.1 hypothetical protein [Deltaproteobacteria bacterium]
MQTLKQFAEKYESIPAAANWYLTDISEAKGRQELFTKQSPQKLKILREHAMIESAVSSNRIEGITADQSRIATIVFGRSSLRDRSEEEIRGYRDALNNIHLVLISAFNLVFLCIHPFRDDNGRASSLKKQVWSDA